jgi:hypothetical protein
VNELKIPPCPLRATDGSNWPRHRAKVGNKTRIRRRVMAELESERRAADAIRFCI